MSESLLYVVLAVIVTGAIAGGLSLLRRQHSELGETRVQRHLNDYLWLVGAVAGSAVGITGAQFGAFAGIALGLTGGAIVGGLNLIRRNREAIENLPIEIEPRRMRDFLLTEQPKS